MADGCQFNNGACALTWKSELPVNSWYPSSDVILRVHGHKGATKIVWIDEEDEDIVIEKPAEPEKNEVGEKSVDTTA